MYSGKCSHREAGFWLRVIVDRKEMSLLGEMTGGVLNEALYDDLLLIWRLAKCLFLVIKFLYR